jgi:hypothetical protein
MALTTLEATPASTMTMTAASRQSHNRERMTARLRTRVISAIAGMTISSLTLIAVPAENWIVSMNRTKSANRMSVRTGQTTNPTRAVMQAVMTGSQGKPMGPSAWATAIGAANSSRARTAMPHGRGVVGAIWRPSAVIDLAGPRPARRRTVRSAAGQS